MSTLAHTYAYMYYTEEIVLVKNRTLPGNLVLDVVLTRSVIMTIFALVSFA